MKVIFSYEVDGTIDMIPKPESQFAVDNIGKSFLYTNKVDGKKTIITIEEHWQDKNRADIRFFELPLAAIEEGEETIDDKVQQSIDMVCVKMEKFYQSIWDKIEQDDAVIRGMIEEFEVGSGISEKTLLRALEIVTKDKQQS